MGSSMHRHREIHEVTVAQVDFGDAARTFHHDGVIALRQTVVCFTHCLTQFLTPLFAEIVVSMTVADGFAVEHHLTGMIALRLQEQGIHVSMTRDARSFGLYSLCTTYLKAFGSGV